MSVNQIEPILQHCQEPGEEKKVIKHPKKESFLHAASISTTGAYLANTTEASSMNVSSEVHLPF